MSSSACQSTDSSCLAGDEKPRAELSNPCSPPVAGALDCMRLHKHAEARARLGLMLAAGDQLSIDRGNWLIAAEMMLEDGPPLATFSQHTLPQEHEAPFTNLVDGRWVDLFVAKLKDFEELAEKKRKLTAKKTLVPPVLDTAPK